MRVLRLLFGDLVDRVGFVLLAAMLTAGARLLAIDVAGSAALSDQGQGNFYWLVLMLAAVALFWVCSRKTYQMVSDGLRRGVFELSDRLSGLLATADLGKLERNGIIDLGPRLLREVGTIQRLHYTLALAVFRCAFIGAVLIYVLFKSLVIGTIVLAMLGVAGLVASRWNAGLRNSLQESTESESQALNLVEQIIRGFSSVKLHQARRRAMLQALKEVLGSSARARQAASGFFHDQRFMVESWLYLPVGLVIFISVDLVGLEPAIVLELALAMVFLFRSTVLTLEELPKVMTAAQSVAGLQELERSLRRCQPNQDQVEKGEKEVAVDFGTKFSSLECQALELRVTDASRREVFHLQSARLRIKRGEAIFVTGENGEGKSRFLTMLAGLYRPSSGRILLNKHLVRDQDRGRYREWFAAVWEDSWLFEKEYGVAPEDFDSVTVWLKRFGLEQVTSFERGGFTRRELSTGQRKRLALIGALMLRRPILILDEWTAGQDPAFVEEFYRKILPELKASGLTVIMAHHDTGYENEADQVWRLRDGRLEVR